MDLRVQQIINQLIDKASNAEIQTDLPLTVAQLKALNELNIFCAKQVVDDIEVVKDPRKIIYKTNEELKTALVALCLTRALINHLARRTYTKEFFDANISVTINTDGQKVISFGDINPKEALAALESEYIYDWMVYRDKDGRQINALIDYKTNGCGLPEYNAGGNPVYEFARFERKYHEESSHKEARGKESAQEAFRNTIISQVATEIAKQQIASGKNPMELVDLLFSNKDYDKAMKLLNDNYSSQSSLAIEDKTGED